MTLLGNLETLLRRLKLSTSAQSSNLAKELNQILMDLEKAKRTGKRGRRKRGKEKKIETDTFIPH